MHSDPTCVFCRIISGEFNSARVLDADCAVAFLDISPAALGHTLLVPRHHYPTLAEMPEEEVAKVAALLPRLCRAILSATGATGLNLVQNNGRDAGQVISHVHYHLIPRVANDDVRLHLPQGKYEGESIESMRSKIAAAL